MTCYPRVEPARIGLCHESDFDCPGSELIRAPDHTLYIHVQVPPADNLSKQFGTRSGKISR